MGQTGVVVLDTDDIDDSTQVNKYTTAGDISKLAGIEAGAQVNTVDSVNAKTGVVVINPGRFRRLSNGKQVCHRFTNYRH